jgi:hypothetical protein
LDISALLTGLICSRDPAIHICGANTPALPATNSVPDQPTGAQFAQDRRWRDQGASSGSTDIEPDKPFNGLAGMVAAVFGASTA